MSNKSSWLGSVALSAMVLACAPALQAKEWTSVNIATEGAYEPWNLTLPGGKISGFGRSFMNAGICCGAFLSGISLRTA